MAINKDMSNLVINEVENQQVYDYMVQNNLINDDELYLVQGENEYKIKQTAVSSPSASGSATAFIDTISQDANGKITATKKSIPSVSVGTSGTSSKTLSHSGTFTAITGLTASNHTITPTVTTYTLPTDNDTKNTAGSTDTSSKIYLVGATSQSANPVTYSHDTAYVGTDGYLYSDSQKVWPRIYSTLIPYGTNITSSADAQADLNTIQYLKVGNYYCAQDVQAKTIKNCPVSRAFMMQVYSPLSQTIDNETTSTWVYRLRKITDYQTGTVYSQLCYVGNPGGEANWIYGSWYITPRSYLTINSTDTNGGSAAAGGANRPIYLASDGTLTACSYTLDKSVPSDAVFTDTNTTNVTAGNGLTGGGSAVSSTGVTLNVGAGTGISVSADAVSLATYGTAGTYGPSAHATLAHSGTFTVPKITTDAYGRVTASNITYTLPADTNTHYTTGITAGASGTTTNAQVTDPYIKIKDDSTHRAQIRLVGGGSTTISSDTSGNITISSPNTDATLTQSGAAADAKAVGDALKNIVTDVFSASTTAPSNTKLLWIDTGNGGIMKYYNGSAWVAIASTWG